MRAMLLAAPGTALREAEPRLPELQPGEVRIRVGACGVCRTDLHIRDGDVRAPELPLVLGHEVVGTVVEGKPLPEGTRVGVPWLGWTCGECRFCRAGRENLCDEPRFTRRPESRTACSRPRGRVARGFAGARVPARVVHGGRAGFGSWHCSAVECHSAES